MPDWRMRSGRSNGGVRGAGVTSGETFRPDIEGLRGVAVLLVIAFHVGWRRLAGGFVGVDIFFVISGFLIAKQLFGQVERSGRVDLVTFWARRLRRLVPLLIVTVAGTLVASLLIYSPLGWKQLTEEAAASTLYVSNMLFARNGQAYFQSAASPFLHTWSLGVEEQFYIGWPLVLVIVALAVRMRRWPLRRTFTVAVVAISVTSFALGWLLTRRGTPWAFYSAPTRAWEFGVGALAFVAGPQITSLPHWIGRLGGWVGLGAACASAFVFDEFTAMPGTAALLPVLGASAVLAFGAEATGVAVGRLLVLRPLRSLGRVSYAWYLFHWPAIVLTAAALQRNDIGSSSIAAGASLVLAYMATRGIEQPVRQSARLAPNRVAYVGAAALSLVVLAGVGVVRVETNRQLDDPYLAHLVAVRKGRSTSGSSGCAVAEVAPGLSECVYGSSADGPLVMLVGDSHAAQWAPALEQAAVDLGLRLVVRTYGGCPAVEVYVARTGFLDASQACLDQRAETERLITTAKPELVVMSNADYSDRMISGPAGSLLHGTATEQAYSRARRAFAEMVDKQGTHLAVIQDNPGQLEDPIECLARDRDIDGCSAPRARVVPPAESVNEREYADLSSVMPVQTLSTVPLICNEQRCLVERDGRIVYADSGHLAAEFTLAMTPQVEDLIRAGLAASG